MTDTTTDTIEQILVEHRAVIEAGNDGLEHAIAAGKLLRVMRETVKKEKKIKWADWLAKNCPGISGRTDRLYRHLAEHERAILKAAGKDFGNGVAECSVRGAVKLIAKPRTSPRRQPRPLKEESAGGVVKQEEGSPDLHTFLPDTAPDELLTALRTDWESDQIKELVGLAQAYLTELEAPAEGEGAVEPGDDLTIPAALDRRGELPAST
jgi:hypothetical protein